jgi:hypothetical protein
MTAMHELVVPKSIPKTFAMIKISFVVAVLLARDVPRFGKTIKHEISQGF